jgi:RNA polymerase sigma-70 factor (ECF subfamily)
MVAGPGTRSVDQTAFEMVVRAYSADLYRFAFWLCRNRWLAQDLVQETFAAAWRARDSLRDDSAIKAWLFSILRNEHVRVHQRKRLPLDDVELDELAQPHGDGGFERVELEELLRALPENYREPLLLQVLGGFSCREIARMMSITEQNVMTRLTRSRQMLQRLAAPAPQAAETKKG